MIVAAYCRVSTDSADQQNSYENQKSFFSHRVEETGNVLYKIYADQGVTGTKLSRPEFDKMIEDAGIDVLTIEPSVRDGRRKKHIVYELAPDRAPLFEEIWVKNTSRFARNTLSFEIIDKLKQKGVYVYFMEQGFNTRDAQTYFALHMIQAFDEQESRDKSVKTKTGNEETARKGGLRIGGKIFGYKYHKENNALDCRLEIIPEEAAIVREIFERAAQGEGIRTIMKRLKEEGHHTRAGGDFGKTTIRHILDNEKYAGLNPLRKYDTGAVFNKHAPKVKKQYETIPCDRIQPIVSPELFYKCKEVIGEKVNSKNARGIYRGLTKYASLVYCGKCGAVYTSNVDKGRRFYNCSKKRMYGTMLCDGRNLNEKALDELMAKINEPELRADLFMDQLSRAKAYIYETISKTIKDLEQEDESHINALKTKNNELHTSVNNLMDVLIFARTETQKAQVNDKLQTLYKEQEQVETRLNSLMSPRKEKCETLRRQIELFEQLMNQNEVPEKIDIEDIRRIIVLPGDPHLLVRMLGGMAYPYPINGCAIMLKNIGNIQNIIGFDWTKGEEHGVTAGSMEPGTERPILNWAKATLAKYEE